MEGVRDRRVLTDGTRTVEIHQIVGNLHSDDLLMVYLPKENLPKENLLIQADTYTPPAMEWCTTEVRPKAACVSPLSGESQVGRAPRARRCRVRPIPFGHRCGQ